MSISTMDSNHNAHRWVVKSDYSSAVFLAAIVLLSNMTGVIAGNAPPDLEAGFHSPPQSAKPLAWWHWINGNVTKAGIRADMEDMKRVGIGGVQMFDVSMYLPPGPVRYGSDSWYEHVQYAVQTASELGLEFDMVNAPGWSGSGGPWVTPETSMKQFSWSELDVEGGSVDVVLPQPQTNLHFYRDVAVLAVPGNSHSANAMRTNFLKSRLTSITPMKLNDNPPTNPKQILNLTQSMGSDARLQASLPPGKWTIIRFGYTCTGSENHPAQPEGTGLEIDKMDSKAAAFQFDRALGRVIHDAGPLAGKAFKGIVFDSFEGGYQNWCADLPEQFERLKSYDLTPFLPVLTGRVVGSVGKSEALLRDFRSVVRGLIANKYFGTMSRLAHEHGLKVYAEAQGGPLNPVSCNEYTDVPMSEFWVPDTSPRLPRIKLVSSTANLLGRKVVAAESFTAKPEDDAWRNCPATLKRSGDYAFTAGINRYILHYYAHQPVTEAAPGFTLGRYGTHFGRLNTWWPYAGEWFKYVARCQFLLQQGRTVADICFLLNEDFGYGYPAKMVDVPDGYDFDICYPQHLAKMEWKNGALSLPAGPAYRLLVLPNAAWAADVATLRRVRELVNSGATIMGEPPVAPAGLLDCLDGKSEHQRLVAELWDGVDGQTIKSKKLRKGAVYRGMQLADVLKNMGTAPDVSWPARTDGGEFRYIHRRSGDADCYFVFNHSERAVSSVFNFRSRDRQPELWNPVTGTQVDAPAFAADTNGVSVPLQLEPYGSIFVVFRRPLPPRWAVTFLVGKSPGASRFSPKIGAGIEMFDGSLLAGSNEQITVGFSDGKEEALTPSHFSQLPVNGPWRVGFPDGRGAPAEVALDKLISWSEHSDPGIKYYSGTAVYRTRFELPPGFMGSNSVTRLDLGSVADIAEVCINGERAGVVWQPPFRLDVSRWLRPGRNDLEIRVANEWVNRMIGDEAIPVAYAYQVTGNKFTDGALQQLPPWLYDPSKENERKRYSFSTWKHYSADSTLLPSGLLGPVTLERNFAITE